MSNFHEAQTIDDGLHPGISFEFADATARASATNPRTGVAYTSNDIPKFARQLDEESVWMLTSTTPSWVEISGHTAIDDVQTFKGSLPDQLWTVTMENALSSSEGVLIQIFDGTSSVFTHKSALEVTPELSFLTYEDNTGGATDGFMSIEMGNGYTSGILITDTVQNKGLAYAANYSSNWGNRNLVDKQYTDSVSFYESNGTLDATTRSVTGNNAAEIDFSMYDVTSSNYTNHTQVLFDDTFLSLRYFAGNGAGSSTGTARVNVASDGVEIQDTINSRGLYGNADYSSNYVGKSYVQKDYVDTLVQDSTIFDTDGNLTGNRTLDMNGYSFDIQSHTSTAEYASGTLTFSGVPANGDSVTINGTVCNFVNSINEFSITNQIVIDSLTTAEEAATTFDTFLNANTGLTASHRRSRIFRLQARALARC